MLPLIISILFNIKNGRQVFISFSNTANARDVHVIGKQSLLLFVVKRSLSRRAYNVAKFQEITCSAGFSIKRTTLQNWRQISHHRVFMADYFKHKVTNRLTIWLHCYMVTLVYSNSCIYCLHSW